MSSESILALARRPRQANLAAVWLVIIGFCGCEDDRANRDLPMPIGHLISRSQPHDPIVPLPASGQLDAKSRLGKLLFHDPRLSNDNTISCASCHDIANGGDDSRSLAVGIGGAGGTLNSPSVLNATYNMAQFWDGRAQSLEEQVPGPIHAANEMGSNWDEVIAKLKADQDIHAQFRLLFSDGITPQSITECIVAYESLLTTPDAPFDRYLRGEENAVSEEALAGYRLFTELGCAACHQGRSVGGNLFQEFGVMLDAAFAIQNSEMHSTTKQRYKVPTLRNVELTAPYLHDGSAATLEEAVAVMGEYQLGAELSDDEIRSLILFLRSLTGVLSEELK